MNLWALLLLVGCLVNVGSVLILVVRVSATRAGSLDLGRRPASLALVYGDPAERE